VAHALLFGRHPRRTLLRVVLLVAGAAVVFGWVLLPVRAEGISMEPTFEPGSLHLVNRLAYRGRRPARGDIVAIRLAGPHVVYVKRVVGLPGERLRITGGQVFIDGRALAEPYVRRRNPSWALPETTLGPDEYFVVGDNRAMRIELHDLGVARFRRIVGRVVY
jgi:signal peptidase I